ncbi:hypothetical protein QYZ88_015010 [Lachnospiraceae bacterium C1.1]|nr:hypothetical protein [Lachnospiraceae bacterium C1.1]
MTTLYLPQLKKGNQTKKIEEFTNEEIIANDIELLTENLYQEFFIEPIEIENEAILKRHVEQAKIRRYVERFYPGSNRTEYIDVDGIQAYFYYPFYGDVNLFSCHASIFYLGGYPEIEIKDDCIEIKVELTISETKHEGMGDRIVGQAESKIREIRNGIDNINVSVKAYNSGLRKNIKNMLEQKREKIQCFFNVAKALEVSIEKNEYSQKHIKVERRIFPIAHNYKQEDYYYISEEDYKNILETIKHTGSTYESTPASYRYMHEEDLRNTLLAALNATYRGRANGEAFRVKGKTDICIEQENRAAFVAECKMWTGPNSVDDAIEQLDSYLTWRDCKTALIYFVRKKGFLKIIDKALCTLQSIENIKELKKIDKNEFACTYMSKSNPGQLVAIQVMLFDMAYV